MATNRTYSKPQIATSIFMMVALLWLTVSIPFVYAAQQQAADGKKVSETIQQAEEETADQSCNPFGNNTEEKAPSNGVNTLSEEYLHHSEDLFHAVELFLSHHHVHSVDEYVSYHGEMLCPPPNHLS